MTISHHDRHVLHDIFARERIARPADDATLENYAAIADWIIARQAAGARPVVIGLCGAQGSGKSTLALVLRALIERRTSLTVAVLSIDDFYLSRSQRRDLAATVHPLFATRGVPGTHDVILAEQAIDRLISAKPEQRTPLPRFDKATDDTAPCDTWPMFTGRADIVLLEGWCVGALPQAPHALAPPINALERDEDAAGSWRHAVDRALAGPYRALFARIDLLLLIAAPSFDTVFAWRLEQERKLADLPCTSPANRIMDDIAIHRFIAHYERLTRHILAEMPARADGVIRLDVARAITALDLRTAQ